MEALPVETAHAVPAQFQQRMLVPEALGSRHAECIACAVGRCAG
jgi:hypothetical protein